MTTDLLDLCRAANVPLLAFSSMILAVRVNDYWDSLSYGRRMIYGGVISILGIASGGSAIKYVTHAEVDFTTGLVTIACVVILTGAWLSRREPRTPPTNGA